MTIPKTPAPASFYDTGPGDQLADEKRYTPAIRIFLTEEERLLAAAIGKAELLVEVGCMWGRYLRWAVERGLDYLGLDIVPRYITAGRNAVSRLGLSPERYRFVMTAAEALPRVITGDPSRAFAFFPFNSFGNASHPKGISAALEQVSIPFLISSYSTSRAATESRREYYEAAGMRAICQQRSRFGVTFSSPDGLNSTAYSTSGMRELFVGIPLRAAHFGGIGIAWSPALNSNGKGGNNVP